MPDQKTLGVSFGLSPLLGRLVELSGFGASAALTEAISLVVEAQRAALPVAWIAAGPGLFYPPDAAAAGVDLSALAVVRADASHSPPNALSPLQNAPPTQKKAPPTLKKTRPTLEKAFFAGDLLLRSGGFGLVVLDLIDRGARVRLPFGVQARLAGLARRHHAAVVFLTHRPESDSGLGPLVSVRAAAARRRVGPGRFVCEVRLLRSKGVQLAAGQEVRDGPPGLR